ncbi:type II secretion system protein [Haloferula sp.]|uniref:type II secretion system protein n=1 Tax=Haloferula sp. TaxID=2497595 RepID=UPI003C7754C7
MKIERRNSNTWNKRWRRGFTLVELMVVIVIIIVLAALAFVGYGRVKLAGHKAASINNIRNLSTAALAVASDNHGRFVDIHANRGYPYLISRKFRDDYGISKGNAYSAANDCWKPDGLDHCQDRDMWDWQDHVSVFGYTCLINDRSENNANYSWINGSFEEPDNWDRIEKRVTYQVGNKTAVRWVPERLGQEAAYPVLFADLCRILNGKVVGNFIRDNQPLGVHVGYIDGHVEWVDGKSVKQRYNGPAKVFW